MQPNFRAFLHNRPRIMTLIVLTVVAAPLVLATFAPSDLRHFGFPMTPVPTEFEYGWPLIWYWRDLALKPGDIQPK